MAGDGGDHERYAAAWCAVSATHTEADMGYFRYKKCPHPNSPKQPKEREGEAHHLAFFWTPSMPRPMVFSRVFSVMPS